MDPELLRYLVSEFFKKISPADQAGTLQIIREDRRRAVDVATERMPGWTWDAATTGLLIVRVNHRQAAEEWVAAVEKLPVKTQS